MRVVNQNSWLWKQGGVAATDVASLFGVPYSERDLAFVLCADKIQMREKRFVRKAAQLAQDSPEWHQWRSKGVGGSEVASVLGANPYRDGDPVTLWKRKTGTVAEQGENANMQRGKKLEPAARALYESLMGWSAEPICVLHDEFDHVRCSLDGLSADNRIDLEIKCSAAKNHGRYLDIAAVPDPLERQQLFAHFFDYYRYQVLYQLLITGAERCHFVGYCPGDFDGHDKLAVIELFPEPFEQERILDRVNQFWGYVERREIPPTDWLAPASRPPEILSLPGD
jgi:putative phage-type endonuclease